MQALTETHLPLANKRTGKVRDLYDCPLPDGGDGLLIVATDRVSAFDVVMANGLPGKGVLLTQIALFWFNLLADTKNHLVSTDVNDIPELSDEQREALDNRIMLCRRYHVIPIECIARGYLAGSGFQDYQKTGKVCGLPLANGLTNGSRLPEPIFTPSTKADTGHDENISYQEGARQVGEDTMAKLKEATLSLYQRASEYAEQKGIILADTKLEFGQDSETDQIVLIDEIFTPDSSRFWEKKHWQPGKEQPSLDKQYIRNYLATLVDQQVWDKRPPGPALPDQVLSEGIERYRSAFEVLTGESSPI